MMNKISHRREKPAIVGSRSQNHLIVREGILYKLRHLHPGHIHNLHPLPASLNHGSKSCGSLGCATVNGSVAHKNARLLGLVLAPDIVKLKILLQLLAQNRPVKRSNHPYIQLLNLPKKSLHRSPVLAADIKIIPPCLAGPVTLLLPKIAAKLKCPKLTKSIGREKDTIGIVKRYHNLRPMDHRRPVESKSTATKIYHIPLLYRKRAGSKICLREKLPQHRQGLSRCRQNQGGILLHDSGNRAGMIRFHVMHNKIVRSPAPKSLLQIREPLVLAAGIYRVHNSRLAGTQKIRIIGHTFRYRILALEQIQRFVIYANVKQVFRYLFHSVSDICFILLVLLYNIFVNVSTNIVFFSIFA